MNAVRYVLALAMVVSFPAAVGWWYVTHPFVGFWRRLGRPLYFVILGAGAFVTIGAVYLVRGPLLSVQYGTNRALWLPALLIYAVCVYLEMRCRKYLKLNILVGLPEIDSSGRGGRLISEGIYGRVRHPRYVAVWLGTVAFAMFTNYLAVYVLAALLIPALYAVAVLEERELRDRFGEAYVRYCQAVPNRFIPRIGNRGAAAGQPERTSHY